MTVEKVTIGHCTLYHGDCRDVIGGLTFDSILCDPPYGLSKILNRSWDDFSKILNAKQRRKQHKNLHSGGTWATKAVYKDMQFVQQKHQDMRMGFWCGIFWRTAYGVYGLLGKGFRGKRGDTMTKEKPIIFSAESVQKILCGTKTQTRIVMKPQPTDDFSPYRVGWYAPTKIDRHGEEYPGAEVFGVYNECGDEGYKSPFGAIGHRLWVREPFWVGQQDGKIYFGLDDDFYDPDIWKKKSPLFMPRSASRLTLEITNVRCERLWDMPPHDALAEGYSTVCDFVDAWNSLNAKRGFGWQSNCWVWVLEFKKIESEVRS